MKAIEINGEIKVYKTLPNSWKGVMGNFSKLSDEEIKAYGFYDVVTPDYNSKSQELSDIFWDAGNEVFTYTINEKEWGQTLDELKQLKITSLKVNIQNKLFLSVVIFDGISISLSDFLVTYQSVSFNLC